MKILLCCASGMSSSLLVQKMREEVKNRHLEDIKIGACAKNQLNLYLEEADVLLLAPQLNFVSDDIRQLSQEYHVDVFDITMKDYGHLDAAAILDQVLTSQEAPHQKPSSNTNQLYQKMMPLANRISLSKPLNAITMAFKSIMSVTVIGSIFVLLQNLPIDAYTDFLHNTGLDHILELGNSTTIELLSVYLSFFIAYHFVRSYDIEGHGAGLLSLVCFFLMTGRENNRYATDYLGSNGVFGAIFIGLMIGYLYVSIIKKDIRIHLPQTVPPTVNNAFEAIIPSFLIITLNVVIVAFIKMTPYTNLHEMIYTLLQVSLTQYISNNIFSFIFFQLITNLLWFFGVHGGNVIGAITNPIYTPLSLANFELYKAGKEPIYIISSVFNKCFISGGVGSMFSLSIIMTFLSRSQRYKTLGKVSLPTTLFYINEPLLFGVPIILNPLFFVPLMFITPILSILTYIVMSIGLVPIPIGALLPWTTPPVIYGLLQGSWKIAVWEVVMIIAAGLMWFPFFNIADRQAYEEENKKCHN